MIGIVGAGAMGGWLASQFHRSGHDVVLIDVSESLVHTINTEGLTVESKDGAANTRVNAVSSLDGFGEVDVVFFFVKAHHTQNAAELARGIVGRETIVVSLQNGWGNADVLAQAFPAEQIVVGVTYHSATVLAPARVAHTGKGATFVGPYSNEASLARAAVIGKLLETAGVENTVTAGVKTEIWKKLILNAATLPTAALTGLCAGSLGAHAEMASLVDVAAREAVAVAQAQGYGIDEKERLERIHAVLRGAGKGKASMLQDAEARRKTEIEVVNGAVVRAAEIAGIDAPINRAMVSLIHGMEEGWQS
ncbi:MAG: ketopantoate reductase family protein [Bacilli bacterium]